MQIKLKAPKTTVQEQISDVIYSKRSWELWPINKRYLKGISKFFWEKKKNIIRVVQVGLGSGLGNAKPLLGFQMS